MKKKLRSGFTTGACSAAAAKIALLSIIRNKPVKDKIKVWFPHDKYFEFQAFSIKKISKNSFEVIIKKFAGDDPDITNGALIGAKVTYFPENFLKISITGGEGIGKVTKPGLPVKIGEYAINPIPKLMIEKNIKEIVNSGIVEVEIFVKDGKKLAKKTLNEKLGIIGGISILGTTGIVKPVSTEAWLETIKIEMNVAKACGLNEIVLVTGRTTENILKKEYNFKDEAYVTIGDHIGFSLKEAARKKFNHIFLAGMFGKFTKIASGEFQTHVKNSTLFINKLADFFLEFNKNYDKNFIKIIKDSVTARNVFEEALKKGYKDFLQFVTDKVCENCFKFINKKVKITAILVGFSGGIIATSTKN